MLNSHLGKTNGESLQLNSGSFMVVEKAKKNPKSNKNIFQSSRAPSLRDTHQNYSNQNMAGPNIKINDQQHFIKQASSNIQELQKMQIQSDMLQSHQHQNISMGQVFNSRSHFGQPSTFNHQLSGASSRTNFNPNQQFVQPVIPKGNSNPNYQVGNTLPLTHHSFQHALASPQFIASQNTILNNVQHILPNGSQNIHQNPLARMQVNNPNPQFFQAQFYGGVQN